MKTTPIKRTPRAPRIGFWPYDLYPYVIHLVIVSQSRCTGGTEYKLSDGCFIASKPFAIMSEAKGRKIAAKLNALKVAHCYERAVLDGQFAAKANVILPFKVPALESSS